MNARTNTHSSSSTRVRGLSGAVRRAARASARRPKTTLLLWFLLIAGLVFAGSAAGTRELTSTEAAVGDSGKAARLLDDAGHRDPATESVLVRSADAGSAQAAASDLARQLRKLDKVAAATAGGSDASADGGRAQLVQVTMRGDPDHAIDHVAAVERRVQHFDEHHPEATLEQAGSASLDAATDDVVEEDLGHAELISLPLTLAILMIAFGALVAASVPLVLGTTSVAGALGAAAVVSQLVPDSGSTAPLVVLIGLAVGVDYSLFYIRREREERLAGKGPEATLDATASTVGRAIVVSGVTVIVALAGLLVTGLSVFASIAVGTMIVVALAVVGSITALPALLQLLGHRIERGRIPFVGRLRARGDGRGGRLWHSVVGRIADHPRAALVASVVGLATLAAPALGMHLSESSSADLPDEVPVVVALRHIEALFPGGPASAQLVVDGNGLRSPQSRADLRELGARAQRVTGGHGSPSVAVSHDGTVAAVGVPMPEGSTDQATATVERLRDDVAPTMHGADVLVGGDAAEDADFTAALRSAMPIVVGIVLALAFVLLLAAFRSPWVAASVIGLNLLSVLAAYGVIVAVFQHGIGVELVGGTETGFVVDWLPLFAFVILFGLSMDYTVVVLERIREARLAGRNARDAVVEGVGATAGAVTSAAIVMVAVFSLFAMLRLPEMKQLGVGLGAAVLIDATVVRAFALPAVIALLGERRWRVRPLRRPARSRGGIIERPAEALGPRS
jgi:RND superfamily putative drug exporter